MNRQKVVLTSIWLAIFSFISFVSDSWGDEKLLYAIRYGIPRTYANILKTKVQVFAIDTVKKESKLIFSDEELPVIFLPSYGAGGHSVEMVSSKKRVFVSAAERTSYISKGSHIAHSIYEFSLDNSNNFKKVFDVMGDHTIGEMFIDPSGNRLVI